MTKGPYLTFRRLCDLCGDLNALTGRRFTVKGGVGNVRLVDEDGADYSPSMRVKEMGQWMDAMRRGVIIGTKLQARKPPASPARPSSAEEPQSPP